MRLDPDVRFLEVIVDHTAQDARHGGNADEGFAIHVVRLNQAFGSQRVVMPQDGDERFRQDKLIVQIRVWLAADERGVQFAPLNIVGEIDGKPAMYPDVQVGQIIPQNVHRRRDAIQLMAGDEAYCKDRLSWLRRAPRGLDRGGSLGER